MQLMFLVLNKVEFLEELLKELAEAGIKGATILDSTGMARALSNIDDLPFFGSFRMLLDEDRTENKTILIVLKEEKVPIVRETVNRVTGGLSKPDTGIMFSVPIIFVEGMGN